MVRQSKSRSLSEDEYLLAEANGKIRHEYVDGHVFAMTGASEAHNLICTNLLVAIHQQLQDGPCRVYGNDMKVRIESVRSYYYPDIVVTCEPFDAKSVFKSAPVLLIEVLSPATSAIDRREKMMAYKKIVGLKEYLIVYQDRQRLELFRRTSSKEWIEIMAGVGEEIVLESLPNGVFSIPLSIIYKGYNPPVRVKESEAAYQV